MKKRVHIFPHIMLLGPPTLHTVVAESHGVRVVVDFNDVHIYIGVIVPTEHLL